MIMVSNNTVLHDRQVLIDIKSNQEDYLNYVLQMSPPILLVLTTIFITGVSLLTALLSRSWYWALIIGLPLTAAISVSWAHLLYTAWPLRLDDQLLHVLKLRKHLRRRRAAVLLTSSIAAVAVAVAIGLSTRPLPAGAPRDMTLWWFGLHTVQLSPQLVYTGAAGILSGTAACIWQVTRHLQQRRLYYRIFRRRIYLDLTETVRNALISGTIASIVVCLILALASRLLRWDLGFGADWVDTIAAPIAGLLSSIGVVSVVYVTWRLVRTISMYPDPQ